KNALVLRDLDILKQLADDHLVHVYVSITSLDAELARAMEPRTSIPSARLRAVEMLSAAGVPVGVMTAPIIPGLNDSEIPQLLEAVKQAGAITANYILLRLPLTVEPVFIEWLQRVRPNHVDKVLGRIQQTRDGKLNSSVWRERMVGQGPVADQIKSLYRVFRVKYGLDGKMPAYNCDAFRPPVPTSGQLPLF
ncbi:MAG: radical SAM protein, partial [Pirellulaceae bacterium]